MGVFFVSQILGRVDLLFGRIFDTLLVGFSHGITSNLQQDNTDCISGNIANHATQVEWFLAVNNHLRTSKVTNGIEYHDGTAVEDLLGITRYVVSQCSQEENIASTERPAHVETNELDLRDRDNNEQDETKNTDTKHDTGKMKSVAILAVVPDGKGNVDTINYTRRNSEQDGI